MPSLNVILWAKTHELGGQELLPFIQNDLVVSLKKENRTPLRIPRGFCWALSHYFLNCMGDYHRFKLIVDSDSNIRQRLIKEQRYQGSRATGGVTGKGASASELASHTHGWHEPISQKLLEVNYQQVSQFKISHKSENIFKSILFSVECAHTISIFTPDTGGHCVAIYEGREAIMLFDPNAGVYGFSKDQGRVQAVEKIAVLFHTLINDYFQQYKYDQYLLTSFVPKAKVRIRGGTLFFGRNFPRFLQANYAKSFAAARGVIHRINRTFRAIAPDKALTGSPLPRFDMHKEEDCISIDSSELWRYFIIYFAFIRKAMQMHHPHLLSRKELFALCDLPILEKKFSKVKSDRVFYRTGDLLAQYSFLMRDLYPAVYEIPSVYVGLEDTEDFCGQMLNFCTDCNILTAHYRGGITIACALLKLERHWHLFHANWGLFTFPESADLRYVCDFFMELTHECFATLPIDKAVEYYLMCFELNKDAPPPPPRKESKGTAPINNPSRMADVL